MSANMSGMILSCLLDCLESHTRQKLAGMLVRLVLLVFDHMDDGYCLQTVV